MTTIILTRDPAGNRRWAAGLRRAGFSVVSAPMIDIAPAKLTPSLAAELGRIGDFDWLVFTSSRTASVLKDLLDQAGLSNVNLPPIAVVGRATAAAAKRAGFTVKFVPHIPTSSGLGAELEPANGRKILLAQAFMAFAGLAERLQSRGAHVTRLPIYALVPRDQPDPQLDAQIAKPTTAIVLASPSATNVLAELHPRALSLPAVAIGPTTAAHAREAGFAAVRQASAPDLPSIISALKLL